MIELAPTGNLTVARTVPGIAPAFHTMLKEPLPGFQIGPEVSLEDAKTELTRLMHASGDPAFQFDNVTNVQQTPPGERYIHLDPNVISAAGASLNRTISGAGKVTLQLVDPSIHTLEEIPDNSVVGPCLHGDLLPEMKTVFSQRIFDFSRELFLVGATLHLFTTAKWPPRSWEGHFFSGKGRIID
jgi:hypothetical protein